MCVQLLFRNVRRRVRQRRIVIADDHRPAPALLGKTVATERAARAVLRLGVEEPPLFLRLTRTQHLAPRVLRNVVHRIVAVHQVLCEQLYLEIVEIQVRTGFARCVESMESLWTIPADAVGRAADPGGD